MVVSLSNIPKGSLVLHFITSGKPGRCKLCFKFVEKLEAHHISYDPQITIKICHDCHHKVHFWPTRLNAHEKHLLLSKKFSPETATKLINENVLGIAALSKLIAPSRSAFIHAHQKLEIKRIEKPHEIKPVKKPEKEPKHHHHKLFKDCQPVKIKV